jgi:hypothetical protein
MKNKKDIIRIGDQVKIIYPHVFVRCGYPKSINDYIEKVKKEKGEQVQKFIQDMGISIDVLSLYNDDQMFSKVYEDIIKIIAYQFLKKDKFGGNERTIHTQYQIEQKDKEFSIIGIRFVKTGIYQKSWHSMDGDYDPPVLCNQKTHKILQLGCFPLIEIEDVHVVKIESFGKAEGLTRKVNNEKNNCAF